MEKYELEIKNLNLSIGNNSILENINLKIKKGEIHCLIGPNGGGKSSLIKCILKDLTFKGILPSKIIIKISLDISLNISILIILSP